MRYGPSPPAALRPDPRPPFYHVLIAAQALPSGTRGWFALKPCESPEAWSSLQSGLNQAEDFGDRDRRCRRIAAMLVFDLTRFQTAVANRDAVRHPNQFPVGKHGAGTLAAVVQDDIDAGRQQLTIELVGCGFNIGEAVRADRTQDHGKGRQRIRPDNAALVVVLLYRGGWQTGDADAVAAHFHKLGLAIDVQESGVHVLA